MNSRVEKSKRHASKSFSIYLPKVYYYSDLPGNEWSSKWWTVGTLALFVLNTSIHGRKNFRLFLISYQERYRLQRGVWRRGQCPCRVKKKTNKKKQPSMTKEVISTFCFEDQQQQLQTFCLFCLGLFVEFNLTPLCLRWILEGDNRGYFISHGQ